VPPMRGCDEARPQAPGSAAAVGAGRPFMRTVRIRPNRRTRTRPTATQVASTQARCPIFPVRCRHSRTPRQRPGPTQRSPCSHSAALILAKRRLCDALGISPTSIGFCCSATSIARIRAALTAFVPRSLRALTRRANLGAAKSCSLVIVFMIRPPTAAPANRIMPIDRGLIMTRAAMGAFERSIPMVRFPAFRKVVTPYRDEAKHPRLSLVKSYFCDWRPRSPQRFRARTLAGCERSHYRLLKCQPRTRGRLYLISGVESGGSGTHSTEIDGAWPCCVPFPINAA
jgi:hypothetical protein